jgi:hypothetical protein
MTTPQQHIPGLIEVPDDLRAKENIPTKVFRFASDGSKYVAHQIAQLIKTTIHRPVVLGLATGATPTGRNTVAFFPL